MLAFSARSKDYLLNGAELTYAAAAKILMNSGAAFAATIIPVGGSYAKVV